MMEVVKGKKVKENEVEEIKKVKKDFTISHKAVRRVLLTGLGAELLVLGKYGYSFYKSGVGLRLGLPYCGSMVIPYWFLAIAIVSPIIPKLINKGVSIVVSSNVDEGNTSELAKLWEKHYGDK